MVRSSWRAIGARVDGALGGVPALLSYLVVTSLSRHAPTLAKSADWLGHRCSGWGWWAGHAETEDGLLDIAYLGSLDRFSIWLLDRLGAESVRSIDARRVPGSVPCAVELALVPASAADRFGRAGWLVMPRYVRHRQRLSATVSKFERRLDARIQKKGVRLRLSREALDLERFQRELYDPMLERRHGDRALRMGRALLRLAQRRGGLLLAELGGRPIAGAIAAPRAGMPDDLEIWALGVDSRAPPGTGLAPVLGWVRWAREQGFAAVDHLASLPLYSDGLTQQKLRWGTELTEPAEMQQRVVLRVHGTSPALKRWLERHTFAVCAKKGIVPVYVTHPESFADTARALREPVS